MNKKSNAAKAADLRSRAENKVKRADTEIQDSLSPDESRRVFHELRVHQIELEMQNEELLRTQVELEAAWVRYFDLYDLAPVGYFTFSEQGLILQANLTAATLLGVARGDLVKQPVSRFILREDQDIFYRHRKKLFETGEPQAYELRLVRRDGVEFWARLETTSVQDPGGAAVARSVVTDVTGRKRAEEEREQRTRQLETANASLEHNAAQLRKLAAELTQAEEHERKQLAMILHDHLQQVLVAAQMKIGLLYRRAPNEDLSRGILEAHDLLREAISASQTLAADLHPPILLDGGLMPGLRWLVQRAKEDHSLTVEVTGEDVADIPEPISILLFQAVRELLLNVVKHAGVDAASVSMDQPETGSLKVVVSDLGRGFAKNPPTEGFGLFHLRERLTFAGGTLEVASAPGKGAQVCVTVPFEPSPRPTSVSLVPEDTQAHIPLREVVPGIRHLLVVDDHTMVRQGLVELLGKETDIDVIGIATNGEQAVQAARNLRPDVILMDISMPGMNGIDATRIITREMPEVRVIGLSIHEDAGTRSKMREAGAVAYCHKSGPVEELLETIRSVARPQSSQSPSP